jgi:sulfotransferase
MTKQFIFNTSMPRAGSELLQVILHQNPRIYGSSTSPLLEYQFAARTNYGLPEVSSQDPDLMRKAFAGACAGLAQGYYSVVTDRPVVCDKNRGWSHYYEWVDQWCPNPKMLCVVRDLRAIVASLERIYRKHRHNPEGPDNPAQLQNMTVDQRVHYWLNTQPVGLALQRTQDVFQRGIDSSVLFVRYEDLCLDPTTQMGRIYEYLGEAPFEHDFDHLVKEVHEDASHFGIFGIHSVQPKIQPSRPASWTDVLPQSTSESIRNAYPWYFNTFGY